MSSKPDPSDITPSILKLRELREKLCSSQKEWAQAFEVRDFVICELSCLHGMLEDISTPREDCLRKSREILDYFLSSNQDNGAQ